MNAYKKRLVKTSLKKYARGRNRTGTVLRPRDFKSLASTNSATRAVILFELALNTSLYVLSTTFLSFFYLIFILFNIFNNKGFIVQKYICY